MVKHRDIGDYSYLWELDLDQVREDIQKAREILDSVRRYLELSQEKE